MSGPFALPDTGVYIRGWLDRAWWEPIDRLLRPFIVRMSSVVLSELRRGALTPPAVRRVERLRDKAAQVWTPPERDWWRAAEVLASLGRRHRWDANAKRRTQNDVLIGLTARRHGAVLVTTDRADFDRIAKALPGLRVIFV